MPIRGGHLGLRVGRRHAGAAARLHGPTTFYDYLVTLKRKASTAPASPYKTINTEVLAWVVKRVAGLRLADLTSQ